MSSKIQIKLKSPEKHKVLEISCETSGKVQIKLKSPEKSNSPKPTSPVVSQAILDEKDHLHPEPSHEQITAYLKQYKGDPYGFVEQVIGKVFFDCRWGSCQYGSAQATFDTLNIMSKYMTQDDMFSSLGVKITFTKALDKKEALHNLRKFLVDQTLENANDNIDDYDDSPEDYIKNLVSNLQEASNIKTFDEGFSIMGNNGGDLWGASPTATKCAFDDFTLEVDGDPDQSLRETPGGGYVFCYNFGVGICCWLLMKYGHVSSEDAYDGFST